LILFLDVTFPVNPAQDQWLTAGLLSICALSAIAGKEFEEYKRSVL
jgi:hypothetical protein